MPPPGKPPLNPKPEIVVLGRGVSMHYRDFSICALDAIDIEVHRGDIFGVIGPAGAGKSTILKILAGRLRPTYGTIKVFGYSLARATRKGLTGFVPDKTAGNGKPDSDGWAGRVANFFRPARPASLGQVLARKPEMLLLDRPFAGLDAAGRDARRELILSLAREGRTIVLSGESLLEVRGLCNRIAILNSGKIEAVGTLEQLFAPPQAVRFLAPVIPERSLQRALKLIREDLGVAEPRFAPPEAMPDAEPRPQNGTPATAPSANKILSSLVKKSPAATPRSRRNG
jgi:ABC-2 type transport system ATP-binding protein